MSDTTDMSAGTSEAAASPDAVPASVPAPSAAQPEPSSPLAERTSRPSAGGEGPTSLDDVVGAVLDKRQAADDTAPATASSEASPPSTPLPTEAAPPAAPEAAAASDAPPADAATDPAAELDDSDPSPEELNPLPAKTRRRISKLLKERAAFRDDALRYRNVTGFMAEAGLSGDEAAQGFDAMARLKRGDMSGFLQIVEPLVQQARQALGHELPTDIREKVDQGYVDEDTARELTRVRYQAQLAQQQAAATQAQITAARTEQYRSSVRDTLNAWDAANARDPDFTASRDVIVAFAQRDFALNPPASPEEALQRVQSFWNSLRGRRSAAPPRAVNPGPSSVMSTPAPVMREPKTLAEAVRLGLERAAQKHRAA